MAKKFCTLLNLSVILQCHLKLGLANEKLKIRKGALSSQSIFLEAMAWMQLSTRCVTCCHRPFSLSATNLETCANRTIILLFLTFGFFPRRKNYKKYYLYDFRSIRIFPRFSPTCLLVTTTVYEMTLFFREWWKFVFDRKRRLQATIFESAILFRRCYRFNQNKPSGA